MADNPTQGYIDTLMLGKELRRARKEAGFSQEQLAEEAGVHRTYISLLERDVKSPTVDVLLRICRALEMKASDILKHLDE